MSDTTINQDQTKLADLSALPASQLMTVHDIEFGCDLAYLYDLLDAIEDQMKPLLHSTSVGDQFAAAPQVRAAELFPHIELSFSDPWPVDHAAELLDAWRAEPKLVAA